MLVERWMYEDHWEKIPSEEQEDYLERKKILIGDYLGIISSRGLPIVLKKESGIDIVYSKQHEFKDPKECDVCCYTKCKEERKIHMVRVIDPYYPEGLISNNTFGVLWKCRCVGSVSKKPKARFKLRSLRKEEKLEDVQVVSEAEDKNLFDKVNEHADKENEQVPF